MAMFAVRAGGSVAGRPNEDRLIPEFEGQASCVSKVLRAGSNPLAPIGFAATRQSCH